MGGASNPSPSTYDLLEEIFTSDPGKWVFTNGGPRECLKYGPRERLKDGSGSGEVNYGVIYSTMGATYQLALFFETLIMVVSTPVIKKYEGVPESGGDIYVIIAPDFPARIQRFYDYSDILVIGEGGCGSVEELLLFAKLNEDKDNKKPIYVNNINGNYTEVIDLLTKACGSEDLTEAYGIRIIEESNKGPCINEIRNFRRPGELIQQETTQV
jgi:predicted Rossmann-fold nucleotide-binding protein